MEFAVTVAAAGRIFVSWDVDPYDVPRTCSTSVSYEHSAFIFGLTSDGINVTNKACVQPIKDFNAK
jgi:hypothetical protein